MNARTKSFNALESSNGNWIIGPSNQQQALYDVPKYSKQKRIPTGNTPHGKSRGHSSETWAESTTLSKAGHESYQKRDGQRGRSEFTNRRMKTNDNNYRRSQSVERISTSTSTTNSSGYISSRENFGKHVPREVVLHKSAGDFGFTMRQISSSMYGSKPVSAFRPTSKVPALQRLNCIDPGSQADRIGLKSGDYIIEVNNECVTCSPHQYVVHLITSSSDALKLKVVDGPEDVFKVPHNSTYPQRTSAAKNTANGRSYSASSAPKSHDVEAMHRSKRSNAALPLQQVAPHANGKTQPTLRATRAPHQTSTNGSTITEKQLRLPVEPVVANIRLSRVVAHDQVFYDSGRKKQTPINVSSRSRTTTSSVDIERVPSFTSTVTIKSEPQPQNAIGINLRNHGSVTTGSVQGEPRKHRSVTTGSVQGELRNHRSVTTCSVQGEPRKHRSVTTGSVQGEPRNHRSVTTCSVQGEQKHHRGVTTGSVQGELDGTVHGQEFAVNRNGSSSDDMNPTYDRVRPTTLPFDTDEGYIRLSANVDYVAQAEEDREQIDFLEMAEKARQLYIRRKSVSQTE